MVLTSELSNSSNSSFFKHFPNLLHSRKISVKGVAKSLGNSCFSDTETCEFSSSFMSLSRIQTFHRFKFSPQIRFTSPFSQQKDLSQKIPSIQSNSSPRDLRLVVHGSKGGRIHPLFNYVVQRVKTLRRSNVEIEVLTGGKPKASSSPSIWLVPLLLLPGKHVQNDIPKIFQRLCNEGVSTQLLPFLGCWPYWLSTLKYLVDLESKVGDPVLIHHPLGTEVGLSYLADLKKRLKIPVIPWTEWHEYTNRPQKQYSPIPFSLAPNQNTRNLRNGDSISSLLEIDFFLFGLIRTLTLLP